MKKLMKNNNINAFMKMAAEYKSGGSMSKVLQSDTRSLEMYIRAAELGHAEAYRRIGYYYELGTAVEQNKSKALEFYDSCSFRLECSNKYQTLECIAASAGDKESMDNLMAACRKDKLSKDDLAQTLYAFQSSSNAMKSKDREDERVVKASLGY